MLRYSRFQLFRFVLAAVAGGAIIGYFYGTHRTSMAMPNLIHVGALFGSIIVISLFLLAASRALAKSKASGPGKGLASNLVAVGAFLYAGLVVALATDWFFVDSVRPTTGMWSFLPHGNLFTGAGREGWVYVGLVTLMVVFLFAEKIIHSMLVYLGFRLPSYKTRTQNRTQAKGEPLKEDAQSSA